MPEGNPLVADAKKDPDGPGAFTAGNGDYGWAGGIGIAESSMDAFNGIKDGDWVSGGLGVLSLAGEIAGAAIDPFGYLMSSVASFLMEHVQPLKDMLDSVAGNPPVIQSYADTWGNVSKALGERKTDFDNAVKNGTTGWTGAGADAYRAFAAEHSDALSGAATVAGAISTVTMIMGQVVSFVRETVRQLIADLVGKLIAWVMEEVFSLGFGTPVVVAQASAAIAKWGKKIGELLKKLTDTIRKVSPLLSKLVDLFEKIAKVFGKVLGKVSGLDGLKVKEGGFVRKIPKEGGGVHGRAHGGSHGEDGPEGGSAGDSSGSSSSGGGDSPSSDPMNTDPGSRRSSSRDGSSTPESDGSPSHTGDGEGSPSAARSDDGSPSHAGEGSAPQGSPSHAGDGSASRAADGSPSRAGDSSASPTRSGDSSPSAVQGGDSTPSHTGDGSPSPARGGTPSHAGDSSPSPTRGSDSTPSHTGDGNPSPTRGSDSTPSRAGDSSPSRGSDSTPSHAGDNSPSPTRGSDSTPSHASDSAPSRGGDSSPSRGGDSAPSHAGDNTPSHSGDNTPSRAGDNTPSHASSSSRAGDSSHSGADSPSSAAPPRVDGSTAASGTAPAPSRTGEPGAAVPAARGGDGASVPSQGGAPMMGGGGLPPGGGAGGGLGGGSPRTGGGSGWTGTPGSPGAHVDAPGRPRAGGELPGGGRPRTPDAPAPAARGFGPGTHGPDTRAPGARPHESGPGPRERTPQQSGPHQNGPHERAPHENGPRQNTPHENGTHQNPHENTPHDNTPHDGATPHHDPLTPDEVNARHAESTPSGSSYHAGDPDMGDLPHRVQPDPDGRYTVDVHVTPDGHARIGDRLYTPEEFADILRRNGDYDGRPIRLIGCDASSNDFAHRLSRELDTEVMAPTKPAWTDSHGRVFSSDYEIGPDGRMRPRIPPDGEWNTHHPDGSTHRAGDDGFAPESHHGDQHDVDADSAQHRGDNDTPDQQQLPYDDVPQPRSIPRNTREFDERFVTFDRHEDSHYAGHRDRPGDHPPIESPREIEDLEPRTRNSKLTEDGVPQVLRGERPLAADAQYNVTYKNGATTHFFTDSQGRVTHVEATPGTQAPFHNPDLRYPLLPGTQYRVANFHDANKHWDFQIGDHGRPVAMSGEPHFGGQNEDFRDTASQNRSGGEGRKAFRGDADYDQVKWAGGHFAANEMGGPGEYVNMHSQMAASNSGNNRDGWIHDASWRRQEVALGEYAARPGHEIENYQVRTTGELPGGVPAEVTMRWQKVTYEVDADGELVLDANGKPIELSRETQERVFKNDPSKINYGPKTPYGSESADA
ncbi:hypothetical protein [Amycolatopsis sp. NPDC003861]